MYNACHPDQTEDRNTPFEEVPTPRMLRGHRVSTKTDEYNDAGARYICKIHYPASRSLQITPREAKHFRGKEGESKQNSKGHPIRQQLPYRIEKKQSLKAHY